MSPPKTQRSVFLNYRNAAKNLSSVSVNNLKNILRRFKESGLNVNGSFGKNVERLIKLKNSSASSLKRKRTPPVQRTPRSPSTWSPKTKNAARTIKRIVTKKTAQKKYNNYTLIHYAGIRAGKYPTHRSAIERRMRTYPVTVNAPLYRGVAYARGFKNNAPTKNKILKNGYFINNSFASYSKNRKIAEAFMKNGYENEEFETFKPSSQSYYILTLPPGRYPAINREKFTGKKREREVTLAPGIYTVNRNRPLTNNGNIRVTYKPLR